MQWGRDRFLSAPFSQWLRIRGQDHAPLNRLPRPHSFLVPHLHKRGNQLSCLRGAPRPSQLAILLAWARSVPRSAVGFKPPAPHTIELYDVSAVHNLISDGLPSFLRGVHEIDGVRQCFTIGVFA